MKNLGNLMKQAQQMQSRMAEMQAKLAEIEVSGASGGGMVQVVVNGKGEMRKIKIIPRYARRTKSRCWKILSSPPSMTPRARSKR